MIGLRSAPIAAGILISSTAFAAEVKITVLYAQPKSVEDFDKYYFEKHMPMVYAVKEIKKVEIARPGPGPDGTIILPRITSLRNYTLRVPTL